MFNLYTGYEEEVQKNESEDGPGKRMKLKGRRQVDTALRRSVEQRIEKLHGKCHLLLIILTFYMEFL